jgi:hypothetical protein
MEELKGKRSIDDVVIALFHFGNLPFFCFINLFLKRKKRATLGHLLPSRIRMQSSPMGLRLQYIVF